jgi:hypothetical protein
MYEFLKQFDVHDGEGWLAIFYLGEHSRTGEAVISIQQVGDRQMPCPVEPKHSSLKAARSYLNGLAHEQGWRFVVIPRDTPEEAVMV